MCDFRELSLYCYFIPLLGNGIRRGFVSMSIYCVGLIVGGGGDGLVCEVKVEEKLNTSEREKRRVKMCSN